MNATNLRTRLYASLDQVAESGQSIAIERKGVRLEIRRVEATSRLERLKKRPTMACSPDELVDHTWDATWGNEL